MSRRLGSRSFLFTLSSPLAISAGLSLASHRSQPLALPDPGSGPAPVEVRVPLCYQVPAPHLPEGRVAIIIDDLGSDLHLFRDLASFRAPLTLAVIPGQPFSRETALEAARIGFEVILHLPMEPLGYPQVVPGQGAVLVGMNETEVARLLDQAMADVPGAVGLNNHMGSRATRYRELMEQVLAPARARGLFFIDSRTTARSVAYQTARELKVRAASRSVFLDAERSPSFIRRQFRQLESIARREGSAIAIGHPFPETLEALMEEAPQMRSRGMELVFASELVQ